MSAADWAAARNILCVRLDNMGDVLMTTPAFRALKAARPDRRLTLLASSAGVRIARHLTDIDEVIGFESPWHRHETAAPPAEDLDFLASLAARRFDAALIFTVYSQNPLPAALMCYWAGIPLRAAHCRENPYRLLTDWVRETEPQEEVRHEVARQLALLRALGMPAGDHPLVFAVDARDRAAVGARLAAQGVDAHRPWLMLHPGATAASRRYPPESFAAAARMLGRRLGAPLVLTGAAEEAALIASIRAMLDVPSVSLAGELSIGELGAAIAMARVLVCNNSGPAHIAAAVGTPVVDLYALTNPQHTPWGVPSRVLYHDVPCKYCYKSSCPQGHHECLRGVPPERVAQAACELWDAGRPLAVAA